MNKKLIKKYKNEFEHWLNCGSLLFKYIGQVEWCRAVDSEKFNWEKGHAKKLIVINDQYVEFRKAFAENKNVQYFYSGTWWNVREKHQWDNFLPNNYRVKEGDLFKEGDFVRFYNSPTAKEKVIGKITKINKNGIWINEKHWNGYNSFFFNHIVLWEPEENEWCWFNMKLEDRWQNPTLMQYGKQDFNMWTIEPFIGELPFNR
jgi:hypothetical protein